MGDWQPWPPPHDLSALGPTFGVLRHAHLGPMGATIYKTYEVDGVIYQTRTGNGGGSWRALGPASGAGMTNEQQQQVEALRNALSRIVSGDNGEAAYQQAVEALAKAEGKA